MLEEIERMQNNLLLIRRAVGWTAEEFGERIGVTRQTINNIEAGRNKLNKTQYIAMRSVLDAEIALNEEETEMLRVLLDVMVDHPENYKAEDRKALLAKANLMTPSILVGATSRKDVSKEWMSVAGAIIGAALVGGASVLAAPLASGAAGAWLAKIVSSAAKTKGTGKR